MGRRNTGERGSTDRARPAGRSWSGGAEGAAAVTRRGLPNSAADVEWRRSPRSSSDPNKGSWRGRRPAGYEVGESNISRFYFRAVLPGFPDPAGGISLPAPGVVILNYDWSQWPILESNLTKYVVGG